MKKTPQKQKPTAKPVAKRAGPSKAVTNPATLSLIIIGLLALTFLVFIPMLSNQFTLWDDGDYVTENSYIRHMDLAKIQYIFTHPIAYNYHPLTILSLGINYSFSQLNPTSYYFVNLLLHAINTGLVFWFIFLLGNRNIHIAAFVALMFAVHPMHVESVAWISERKDVLYTLFYVAALISYLYYLKNKQILYYLLTLLLALCSMASKPAAIILPFVLLLIDYYKQEKINARSLLMKLPFIAFAVFFLYMTWIAQTHDTMLEKELRTDNHFENFLYAWYGFLTYAVKLFIPFHLAAFHPYTDKPGGLVYLAPVIVAAMTTGVFFLKKYRTLLLFGLGFFLVNLIMVLQFISVGSAMYAERYSYVSYLGLLFPLGVSIFEKSSQNLQRYAWIVIGLFSLSFAYLSHERTKVWHNAETLWSDEIEKYPEHYKGYYGRGNYYAAQNEHQKAIEDFSNSIKYNGGYRSYSNRAAEWMKVNAPDRALQDVSTSLKLNNQQPEAYITLAQIELARNQIDSAGFHVSQSLRLKPTYEGYFTRAAINKAAKKYDEALSDYTAASALSNDVSLYVNRGNVYYAMGNYQKAIEDYNKVLHELPDNVKALSNRGSAYYQLNKIDEALSDYNRAIALRPGDGQFYASRSYMYDKKGDKQSALRDAQAAMKAGATFPADYLARLGQ